ncbi:cytochrome b [Tepidicaulis sp. LMO-SS28]|uniref:cytochrome b n=1 Tax=Tepidicaulis sp. LMO-SS28 TaxID=3447455 RepID=UPI003EDF4101
MSWKNTETRYGTLSIAIHWLMFVLIASVYAAIELREFYPKGSETRELFKQWHFMLGLSVFVLVWLRIAARAIGGTPRITPPLPRWQAILAKLVHLALYIFMVAMPLAGWVILSAAGKPVPFFGLELPALTAENEDLSKLVKEWHGTIGTTGYVLIGIHTLAALIHHYIQKDNTLTNMLPARRSGAQRPDT